MRSEHVAAGASKSAGRDSSTAAKAGIGE